MSNPFVHVELETSDVARAKDFYGALFDWKLNDTNMGPAGKYTTIGVGQGTGGGMMKNPMPSEGSKWLPYVEVDDLASATAKAEKLGAKVIKKMEPVGDMGQFSIITDPTGAMLGLWEQKKH